MNENQRISFFEFIIKKTNDNDIEWQEHIKGKHYYSTNKDMQLNIIYENNGEYCIHLKNNNFQSIDLYSSYRRSNKIFNLMEDIFNLAKSQSIDIIDEWRKFFDIVEKEKTRKRNLKN